MIQSPTFALAIPCKNGAAFLPRLFESVRAQTRPFDEIWLFDDGSNDKSGEIAEQLGARILKSEKSLGPSAARNRLIAASSCEWIHFHDADDTMSPTYLEKVSARVNSNTDIVVCNMIWLEEETGRRENHWRYSKEAFDRHAASYLVVNTIGGINGLYRKSALIGIGGFNENLMFWEDTDLNLRLAEKGAGFDVLEEDLVTAFRRKSSFSNSNLTAVWMAKLQLIDRLRLKADHILLSTIAVEAEAIANRLALLKAWNLVPSALKVAQLAGGNPPTTKNPFLRTLKRVAPSSWAFRLQVLLRKFKSHG